MADTTSSIPEEFDPFAAPTAVTLPTTPAQLEMWISAQADEGAGAAYNESFSIRLEGEIDDQAIERSLRALPDFHEALRGHFSENGQSFILEPSIDVPIARHDLSGLLPDDRESQLARIVREDSATLFDLTSGPLFRATVVTLDPRTRMVLMGAHHLACDGWSLDVLLADFGRLYSSFAGGAHLPEPPKHGFSDYVKHCATSAIQAKTAASLEHWRKTFATIPDSLSLPEDGSRPLKRSYGAIHGQMSLEASLLSDIRSFAKRNHLSLFNVLIAGYATLLHRLSGAPDLVIGIPVAGHAEADMEDCVGHLVNLVPIRVRFENGQSFLALCQQLAATVLDARENAFAGFGEIVKDLKVPHDPSRIPLVPVMFTHVQKYAPGKLVFAGCQVDYALNSRSYETFELSLNALESKDGLSFHAHANADLFSAQWLSWRLSELKQLLRVMVGQSHVALDTLSFLPEEELAFLLAEARRTRADYPHTLTMPDLVAAQVRKRPDATAVIEGESKVTYAELDGQANRIARALRTRGIGRGQLVGICLERSAPMIAALLGVQKSGAGYIPLDPSFPPERLATMVEDSKLAMVLSQAKLAAVHGAGPQKTIELDHDAALLDAQSSAPLDPNDRSAGPDDTAYVLYTSGSTGKPKGVCVHHRAAVNFLESMRKEPGLSASDKLLAVTTLSFDIALLEIMGSLSAGATIVLATREEAMEGVALRSLMDRHGVTVLQATPVTWRILLAADWRGAPGLKALVGGEALPKDLARALVPKVGELWNMYGPTETTVWSTCGRVFDPDKGIDIGRPIANTSVWILDPHGNRCPIGVVGEIHIGGDGVALGYLGRPELTAEKFIPDRFSDVPGARLYRTGDLGRLRKDGKLECLGRVDFQVKVRGFRIELGEIEAAIARHPAVKQAVVTARTDSGSEAYLAAYISCEGDAPTPQDLRTHLKQSLPDYMVPQHFLVLPSFPLTPNGKIDRKALPSPISFGAPLPQGSPFVSPRNDLEARIAIIFARVLGLPSVGVDQDFFSLGGTSVSAIAACVRIEQELDMKVPLRSFFEAPTVEGIARRRLNLAQVDDPVVVTLQAGQPGRTPLFCIMGVHVYFDLARQITDGTPVIGIHVPIRYVPKKDGYPALAAVAQKYLEVLRRECPAGPYALAGLCYGGLVAYEVARLLSQAGEEVRLLAMFDGILPRGYHKDPIDHVASALVGGVQNPSQALRWLLQNAAKMGGPILSRFSVTRPLARHLVGLPEAPPDELVDLAIDGPETMAEVTAFEARAPYLDVPLLAFRALGEPRPSWLKVHNDLGWCGLTRSVRVVDVEGDHLGILRSPHTRLLASEIMKAIATSTR